MSLSYSQVDEILKIIEEFPAAEIRFEHKDLKLFVRKASSSDHAAAQPVKGKKAAVASQIQSPAQVKAESPVKQQNSGSVEKKGKRKRAATDDRKGLLPVTAPMMGVFYRAPAPGAEPFVKVGQHVLDGAELGIIEVMKVMNLIKSPYAGIVAEIDAENAQMVEVDQVLMWLKP